MKSFFKGKTILVTGGTGSIGSEIVRQLLKYDPKIIRIFSNDETAQFYMEQELKDHKHIIRTLIGDVRDKERLKRAMEDVEIVFHAAAFKHVHLCEYNPLEAVQTNVFGTKNIIELSLESPSVEKVINISTDKAANPISTMGSTKLLTEKLITWATFYRTKPKPIFASVRFGNVINSRGSVIPLFVDQIKKGGPVTITDGEMCRYMMTISDAVRLVLDSAMLAKGGETFVLKMPRIKITNLVEVLIDELSPKYNHKDIKIEYIGMRPGEKLNEILITKEEAIYSKETDEMFIILPNLQLPQVSIEDYNYPSSRPLKNLKDDKLINKKQIKELLIKEKIL